MNNDLISRDYVKKIIISEFVDLQDGTEEWRTYVNDTCENILNKVHNAPTVEYTLSDEQIGKIADLLETEWGYKGIREDVTRILRGGRE